MEYPDSRHVRVQSSAFAVFACELLQPAYSLHNQHCDPPNCWAQVIPSAWCR
jgi:hypothetical protein